MNQAGKQPVPTHDISAHSIRSGWTAHLYDSAANNAAATTLAASGLLACIIAGVHFGLFTRLDDELAIWFNLMAGRSWALDRVVVSVSENVLAKGLPAMAAFFYAWFEDGQDTGGSELTEKRQTLLYTIMICIPALILARALAWGLPYRPRPIADPRLHLHLAYTFDPGVLFHWSSFPSDHMILFMTLATGVVAVSVRAGIFLYLQAVLVIALPRLYLGIHYPSDLIAGALIGCAIGLLAHRVAFRGLVIGPGVRLHHYSPGLFYAALFYLGLETALLYDHFRMGAVALSNGLHAVAQHFAHHG
jgi:undecaprenyl-diphosphatase